MTSLDVDVGVTGDDDAAVKNLVIVEKSDNQALKLVHFLGTVS